MDQAWQVALLVLWGIVIVQGLFLVFLYRQVGINLLNRAAAIDRDGLPVGSEAPDVNAIGLDGSIVRLAQLRSGLQLVIFGSPTCRPCRGLLPIFVEFAREHTEIQCLFVSVGPWQDSLGFHRRHDFGKVVFLGDPEKRVLEHFEVRVTPFGHLIGGDGTVRAKGLVNNREHLALLARRAGLEHFDKGMEGGDGENKVRHVGRETDGIVGTKNRPQGTGRPVDGLEF